MVATKAPLEASPSDQTRSRWHYPVLFYSRWLQKIVFFPFSSTKTGDPRCQKRMTCACPALHSRPGGLPCHAKRGRQLCPSLMLSSCTSSDLQAANRRQLSPIGCRPAHKAQANATAAFSLLDSTAGRKNDNKSHDRAPPEAARWSSNVTLSNWT